MDWTRILAYITGSVDQELLLRNEYLAAENRILRAQLNGCLRLSDAERATLGEIGFRLGRKALSEVVSVAQPDTILAWHRRLIARKFEGSRARRVRGRPADRQRSRRTDHPVWPKNRSATFRVRYAFIVPECAESFPVVDPFLNLPGRGWNILDRRTRTEACDRRSSSRLGPSLKGIG